ncbi:MAG: glycosyltransferase family 1 protein [Candidatus Omnitrophota bacterium]|jgi:hypothetical protein|nr:MAG: glycosyltransferase family 1 protein [Candidatus Omnitrophota bacterium]
MNDAWIPLKSLQTPVLQQNLSYVSVMYSDLFGLMHECAASADLLFQKRENLIACKTNEAMAQWIFGKESPQQELAAIRREWETHRSQNDLIVLLGNAIGYALAVVLPALLNDMQLRILVVEPQAARIRACFSLLDLRAALDTGRLHFAVHEPNLAGVFSAIRQFNLWNAKRPMLYVSPEMRSAEDTHSFAQQYVEQSLHQCHQRREQITRLKQHSQSRDHNTIQKIVLIDCWPGAPGSAHIAAIHHALQRRTVETTIFPLNRYRIDAREEEYRRLIEPSLLSLLDSFQPDMIVSYGYHAPKFIAEEIYQAAEIVWLQAVSNIAYHDTRYYPGEHTALIERNLIPYFTKRGAPHAFFVPLMADYVSPQPTLTNRRIPIVFVGNSLGLSPQAVQQFRRRWTGRDQLLHSINAAEHALGRFDTRQNLYDYLSDHPLPQIHTEEEEYVIFRYLLCQGSAFRRRKLLEKIAPLGLGIWGGDWPGYLPPDSPLQRCLKGHLPMQEEPKIFSFGNIFVNIQSIGHVTGPNMRFFNVPGMGGFQISDGHFSDYLQADRETVYYESEEEFLEKVRYYLHHPNEADEIRARAHARVLRDWTYDRWVAWVSDELHLVLPDQTAQ